ncbi:helix-turn-helix domain-containing protein [Oceanobacillus salinisoli]|uniref:helix-turn-helix domain-containing protein n=1 Tax=Oceanobacillus salinisoli TaxID=2678611 RepID=UPI0012E103A8|nr:helix-turn-helix domain-containing protein [Oceanobacillus salinisoli]
MLFEWILLDCFKTIHAERTASSVYHLLKGKRSIQTVQDAHIYKLNQYYGIYKHLTKAHFESKLTGLMKENFLEESSSLQSGYFITRPGYEWFQKNQPGLSFEGLRYYDKTDVFLERLLLLIQTLTNSKMSFYSFIPVIDNSKAENWVKQVYKKVKGKESHVLTKIYEELHILLSSFSEQEASIFVDRLTGYKKYGLSLFQLAEKYQMTEDDVYFTIISMTHRILKSVETDKTVFSVLPIFIKDKNAVNQLTKSANETYQYLINGYSISQITSIRNLKENTIFDHIVEIALYTDNFPIRDYVNQEEQNEIIEAIEKAESYRLKDIKKLVADHISYFQIRLVIATVNK